MNETSSVPALTIRRWLLNTIVTFSAVGGALIGLAILFLAEGFFDIGQDPAISTEQEIVDTKMIHQRLVALEEQLQINAAKENNTTPIEETQKIAEASKEHAQRVNDLEQQAYEKTLKENYMARLMVGLTQLKNAYESDTSLENGIHALQETVKDTSVQDTLAQLDTIAKEKLPSRQEILTYIHSLQDGMTAQDNHTAQNAPAATPAEGNSIDAWKSRAQNMLGQFVQVRPTQDVQQEKAFDKTLNRIAQAVQGKDYSLAAELGKQLPSNPKTDVLVLKLNARAKAQNLVHSVVSGVTNSVSNPNSRGALY